MKVLYFDCFAGAAGDMILGALLDAGLPFEELRRALGSLAVEGWDVSADRVIKAGITATKFKVHEHAHAHQQIFDRAVQFVVDIVGADRQAWVDFVIDSAEILILRNGLQF